MHDEYFWSFGLCICIPVIKQGLVHQTSAWNGWKHVVSNNTLSALAPHTYQLHMHYDQIWWFCQFLDRYVFPPFRDGNVKVIGYAFKLQSSKAHLHITTSSHPLYKTLVCSLTTTIFRCWSSGIRLGNWWTDMQYLSLFSHQYLLKLEIEPGRILQKIIRKGATSIRYRLMSYYGFPESENFRPGACFGRCQFWTSVGWVSPSSLWISIGSFLVKLPG